MEIQREIINTLKTWQNSRRRKPLVLQGASQVGESWALKRFGKERFDNVA